MKDANQKRESDETIPEINDEKLDEWWESFQIFDKDGNQHIDHKELATVLRSLGQNPTDQEVNTMIADADFSNDGVIDFNEFVAMMVKNNMHCKNSKEEMEAAFKVFDKNGDGFISAEELKTVMKTMGDTMDDDDLEMMMKEADINADGKIDLKEFTEVICK